MEQTPWTELSSSFRFKIGDGCEITMGSETFENIFGTAFLTRVHFFFIVLTDSCGLVAGA